MNDLMTINDKIIDSKAKTNLGNLSVTYEIFTFVRQILLSWKRNLLFA